MRTKIKRVFLVLNIIFDMSLGYVIFLISNLLYKYNRIETWSKENNLIQFSVKMQNLIMAAWIIWGCLILLSVFFIIAEFKEK